MISGIIKSARLILEHLPRPWLFRMSQKPNLIIDLSYIVSKKITAITPSQLELILLKIMPCARNLQISQL